MSLLLVGSSMSMDQLFEKMMKSTARHVLESECWGENNKNNFDLATGAAMEKCQQLAPSVELESLTSNKFIDKLFPNLVQNPFKQFQVQMLHYYLKASAPIILL